MWAEDDDKQIYLEWKNMPNFCRTCQASDHCRGDCPQYKKFLKCHNCNEGGHVIRNCPRNNQIDLVTAPSKKSKILAVRKKERKVSTPPVITSIGKDSSTSHASKMDEEHKDSSMEEVEKEVEKLDPSTPMDHDQITTKALIEPIVEQHRSGDNPPAKQSKFSKEQDIASQRQLSRQGDNILQPVTIDDHSNTLANSSSQQSSTGSDDPNKPSPSSEQSPKSITGGLSQLD